MVALRFSPHYNEGHPLPLPASPTDPRSILRMIIQYKFTLGCQVSDTGSTSVIQSKTFRQRERGELRHVFYD